MTSPQHGPVASATKGVRNPPIRRSWRRSSPQRVAGDNAGGRRLRGLIVSLWRGGLRIQDALPVAEAELDQRRCALLVRHGKGGAAPSPGWSAGWDGSSPGSKLRLQLPVGPLFCVINSPTRRRDRLGAGRCHEATRDGVRPLQPFDGEALCDFRCGSGHHTGVIGPPTRPSGASRTETSRPRRARRS
jgi:hypothetical protein